jgi:hypothetical protein
MIKSCETSNAQTWELEITCRNRAYKDAIVLALLKHGVINFEVECIEVISTQDEFACDGKFLIFMWTSGFCNLLSVSTDLAEIQEKIGL